MITRGCIVEIDEQPWSGSPWRGAGAPVRDHYGSRGVGATQATSKLSTSLVSSLPRKYASFPSTTLK
jgi:hypothetical protein